MSGCIYKEIRDEKRDAAEPVKYFYLYNDKIRFELQKRRGVEYYPSKIKAIKARRLVRNKIIKDYYKTLNLK